MVPLRKQDFTIAIICALTSEADAVEALFDETYDRHSKILRRQPGDTNAYVNGRIGEHKVVLCYMPGMGGIPASMVASNLRFSYTAVELALVVGVCGGAPVTKSGKEVFLADVIISESVIQYDFGRQYPGGFERKTDLMSTLGRPGPEIRSLLASLRSRNSYRELQREIVLHLRAGLQFEDSPKRPDDDILYDSSYVHKHRAGSSASMCLCFEGDTMESFCSNASRASCSETGCDGFHIKRIRNGWHNPSIHIGAIASADTVMKSGKHRDMIIHGESEEIFGFEMEGAGVWDNIPCIVIKGVCDYSDSHKNKEWQPYAALVAAATAKAFLSTWCPASRDVDVLPTLIKTTNIPQIRQFIGRAHELDNLRERLTSDSIYERVAVLQGPPGIGKTHLAVKYADEFHKEYKAVIWLDASSPLRLLSSFSNAKEDIEKVESLEDIENESRLTRSIESIEHSLKRLRYFKKLRDEHTGWENSRDSWKTFATFEDVRLVKHWLSSMKTAGWLLVFDDYQPPTDVCPSDAGDPIEYFFPESLRNGHIVITTQSLFERWHSITLGKIDRDQEGLDILLSNIRRRRDIPKDPDAIALVKQMDGLPLALALAGNYLSDNNSINCRQYLDRHEEEWAQLQNETQRLPSYRGTLDSCWIIAFSKIPRDSIAFKIVCDWTFLDSQDIWFEFSSSSTLMTDIGVNIYDFDRAMNLLLDYGIVEVASDPSSDVTGSRGYNMQKTAHAWLVDRFKNLLSIHSSLEIVAKYFEAIELGSSSFQDLHRLLPHANRCYDFIMQGKERFSPTERTLLTTFVDTTNLQKLARILQRASYGKSRAYNLFLSMLYLENPEKAHAVKAEKLLLLALRNIEKTDTMDADNKDFEKSLIEHLASLRFDILFQLESLYAHNSEFLKSEAVTRQKVRLHISRHEIWQAFLCFTAFAISSILSVLLLASGLMVFALSTRVLGHYLKTFSDIKSFHRILTLLGSLFMSHHWTYFMVGSGNRRKNFVLSISSLALMEGSRWYTVGPPSFDLTLTPIILMVSATLPILFNEVLC